MSIEHLNEQLLLLKEQLAREEDITEVIRIKREILDIEGKILDEFEDVDKLSSTTTFRALSEEIKSKPVPPRYATGIKPLDEKLNGGIEIGTFVQLAGESFAGKTHLVLEILSNVAHNSKVMLFNFEMGERRIVGRLDKLLTTADAEENFIINSAARDINLITKEIRSRAKKDGIKFFAIDSKMKIEVKDEDTDLKAFRRISNELSKVVQEEEVIIILINQMSEADIKNGNYGLKGGNDQMYDADIALFYVVDKKKSDPDKWERKLVCRKNRQDEILFSFKTMLDWNGKTVEHDINKYEVSYE